MTKQRRTAVARTRARRAPQVARPHGWRAPWIARSLNRRNLALIQTAMEALDVSPGERVLDVGFGGAISLELLLEKVQHGQVTGVDISGEMVRRARRVYAAAVRSGHLVVEEASVDDLPFDNARFDAVLTVQTIHFWHDTSAGMAELWRVLRPGGRLVVAALSKDTQLAAGFPGYGFKVFSEDDIRAALTATGFTFLSALPHAGRDKGAAIIGWRPVEGDVAPPEAVPPRVTPDVPPRGASDVPRSAAH